MLSREKVDKSVRSSKMRPQLESVPSKEKVGKSVRSSKLRHSLQKERMPSHQNTIEVKKEENVSETEVDDQ